MILLSPEEKGSPVIERFPRLFSLAENKKDRVEWEGRGGEDVIHFRKIGLCYRLTKEEGEMGFLPYKGFVKLIKNYGKL